MSIPAVGQLSLGLPRAVFKSFKPSESQVETSICHYLQIKGFFFWKNAMAGYFDSAKKRFRKHVNPYVRNGVPDLILIHKGQFIGLEVKSEKGKQSESQIDFQRQSTKAGAKYFVVRSIADVEAILGEITNGTS